MEVTATARVARVTVRGFSGLALLAALALALVAVAFGSAQPAFAADLVTGTVQKDGALYAFQVENGEATITGIQKAPGNSSATYEALLPSVVAKDDDGWQALSATVPDGTSSFLVTAVAEGAAGGRVSLSNADGVTLDYNDEIVRIVIPGMVTSVGSNAFAGCREALEVVFDVDDSPDVQEHASHLQDLGDYAFAGCSKVAYWDLPDSLLRVGKGAFLYGACDSITRLKLPAAPTAWAAARITFSGMPLCTQVEVPEGCVNLPNLQLQSLQRMHLPSTLRGDVSLMTVDASDGSALEELTAQPGCSLDSLQVVYGDADSIQIPDGVQSLSVQGAFSSLELPSSLTAIVNIRSSKLKSLTVPPSVRQIGPYAFAYDSALESIAFSPVGALNTVGNSAFLQCASLTSAQLPPTVVNIEAHAFQQCDSLEEVVLPASISVAVAPFKQCANLRKVSFAPGSRLFALQAIAEDCSKLAEVSLPDGPLSLSGAADHLVSNCPALDRVFTFNPGFALSDDMFPDCGSFSVYGWGVDAKLMNSCEESGLAFVPYAELDANGYNAAPNTLVAASGPDSVEAVCRFSTATSFDYERVLVPGQDFAVEKAVRDGLAYFKVVGDGVSCFGVAEVPAMQDVAAAEVSAIGQQVVSGGRAACPRPRVTLGGRVLVPGVDYELSYEGNDRAGTAALTVSGKGNYAGSQRAEFQVVERNELSAVAGDGVAARIAAGLAASSMPAAPAACDTVVVAWAFDHAAVAAGCALSAAEGAQLLVVSNAGGLTSAQKAALATWGVSKAQVIGGAASCGDAVLADLGSTGLECADVGLPGASSGLLQDAAALSCAVVSAGDAAGAWGAVAVVANPSDPATCLAAAAFAGAARGPLVFTQLDGTLSAEAAKVLADFDTVVLAGDAAAVDASAETELVGVPDVVRASGSAPLGVSAALVACGRDAGVYAAADASYSVPIADAGTLMPYAACAARSRSPLTIVQ